MHATIGKDGIRRRHVQWRCFVCAESHRRGRFHRSDTGRFGDVRYLVIAHLFGELHGSVIQRHRQRIAHGHFAVVFLFVIARLVDLIAVSERTRLILDHRSWSQNRIASVQSGINRRRIYEWLKNRSGRPLCQHMVQLAEAIVSSTH